MSVNWYYRLEFLQYLQDFIGLKEKISTDNILQEKISEINKYDLVEKTEILLMNHISDKELSHSFVKSVKESLHAHNYILSNDFLEEIEGALNDKLDTNLVRAIQNDLKGLSKIGDPININYPYSLETILYRNIVFQYDDQSDENGLPPLIDYDFNWDAVKNEFVSYFEMQENSSLHVEKFISNPFYERQSLRKHVILMLKTDILVRLLQLEFDLIRKYFNPSEFGLPSKLWIESFTDKLLDTNISSRAKLYHSSKYEYEEILLKRENKHLIEKINSTMDNLKEILGSSQNMKEKIEDQKLCEEFTLHINKLEKLARSLGSDIAQTNFYFEQGNLEDILKNSVRHHIIFEPGLKRTAKKSIVEELFQKNDEIEKAIFSNGNNCSLSFSKLQEYTKKYCHEFFVENKSCETISRELMNKLGKDKQTERIRDEIENMVKACGFEQLYRDTKRYQSYYRRP